MDSTSDNELTPTKCPPALPTIDDFLASYPAYAILLDPAYRILKASDKFLTYYGLAEHEIIGSSLIDVINEFKLIPDSDSTRAVIEIARSSGKVYVADDIKGEEESFWTLQSNPIIKGGVLLYMFVSIKETTSEHTDRESINDQMDSSDSYRILVQQVKDYAMFMLDPAGLVKTWNVGAQLLKGYAKEEIIGRHFSTFYTPEDLAAGKPQKEIEIALREGKVEDESWRLKKNGERFWANVTITTVYRGGVHVGFAKITRDLTERKAAENRLIESYKEADKTKSAFVANMSHEIRTPLNCLMISLDLLLGTELTGQQKEHADIMKESGAILAQIINEVLDLSKLDSGGFALNVETINIANITAVVVRGLKPTVKPGVLLESAIDEDVPNSVKGDGLRYRQIVQNLTSNAIKFTEAGSVFVYTSLESETLTSCTIKTVITDTGIGISADAAGLLFTRFTQIDPSATKLYKGTGLGLTISKAMVELMDGAIGYHPNPDAEGSVFWFTVKLDKAGITTPLQEIQNRMESVTLASPGESIAPADELQALAPTKHLLVAEDNLVTQKVVVMLLKKLGFTHIDLCVNGAEAIEKAKENKLVYAGILMDISMPIMSGLTATAEIRRAGIGLPIIAMTANALKSDVEGYLEKGFNAYVSKPVDKAVLVEVLLKWLK
ncbi:related to Two-component system protein A [Phialocephala subalpina]|uniref:Related to Two-component system protein A n=1 Tax=Phialocephala subalpina TaxID=576137 RepID=A0A1L7XWE6_9HELO|nr:related to Two-component system protein A [Phialocephala subalpina]